MGEFHQEGTITTIHNLMDIFDEAEYLERLERKLEEFSKHLRICLLLPCLYKEIQDPQIMNNILENINQVDYIHHIAVALGGAQNEREYKEAREYFSRLKRGDRDVKLVWIEGPRIKAIFEKLQTSKIEVGVKGKGQSVWMALGYLFAREDAEVIALHDCDIVTYDRLLLGRLLEPTANPNNDFEFCKGYYVRISPKEREMKGRTTRLFVAPFVETLIELMQKSDDHALEDFFRYHRSFRYPLSGEFSFLTRLARGITIAHDWGLEVSTLSEVYNRVVPRKIAQVDLVRNYEHKHQELSEDNPMKGLHRMVIDIAKFYLHYIRANGHSLNDEFIDMLKETYLKNAVVFVKKYSDDAESNELYYDRHKEERTVELFSDFIGDAWQEIRAGRSSKPLPSWNRVAYSVPGIYRDIMKAVEEDNA